MISLEQKTAGKLLCMHTDAPTQVLDRRPVTSVGTTAIAREKKSLHKTPAGQAWRRHAKKAR